MKKTINLLIITCLFIGVCTKLYGQDTSKGGIILSPVIIVGTAPAIVNERLISIFAKNYKNAREPRWFRQKNNYLVKFIMNDENCMTLYTQKGRQLYHIHYGCEKELSDDVRRNIKTTYAGYTITSAINVNQDYRDMWYINLVDNNSFMLLKLENGELIAGETVMKSL